MKKILTVTVAIAALAFASVAIAASTNGNKLQCFAYFGATCELIEGGASIYVPDGGFAGVQVRNSNLSGKLVGEINKLAFSYTGGTSVGGSPRVSFPVDTNGDGMLEDYVSIDTGCDSEGSGTVDAINDPTCPTSLNAGATYVNFAAFVAANPTYRVATDDIPFVLVDQPGTFTITNVQLGRGPARGGK